jgi:hypothetical protein
LDQILACPPPATDAGEEEELADDLRRPTTPIRSSSTAERRHLRLHLTY